MHCSQILIALAVLTATATASDPRQLLNRDWDGRLDRRMPAERTAKRTKLPSSSPIKKPQEVPAADAVEIPPCKILARINGRQGTGNCDRPSCLAHMTASGWTCKLSTRANKCFPHSGGKPAAGLEQESGCSGCACRKPMSAAEKGF
ncbi:hypothetical protein C8J56DRAFT_1026751 [Mycena floridula]|nr:hypothetical protein C8J56DRAFT_1026751 [Mycena floridula]